MGVFGGSEQPEEADDDEVAGDGVEDAPFGVVKVEDVDEAADDGDVGRVGAVLGLVFALESPEESHEYGPEGAVSLLAGIWLTQVGDPRGHGAKGGTNGISADRVVGEPVLAVAEGEDEEVSEASFAVWHITEGWIDLEGGGEVAPVGKGPGVGAVGLGGVGAESELQSSIEVSAVAVAGGRCSSFQGVG